MSRFLGLLSILALTAAAWFSALLARADHVFRSGDPRQVARASALLPLDTEYLSLFALQTEYAGGDPRPLLQRMIELTPLASTPRIRLGLDAEARGDPAEAERWLLDAVRVDRQFEPAWTLANFYFRQQRLPEFWKWIRAALEVSYGDRTPAFELCWNASDDPAAILASAIPERHEVIAAYVGYLLQQEKFPALKSAAMKLAQARSAEDRPLLDQVSDALIQAHDYDAAAAIWATAGNALDANFAHAGHGFDWRFIQSPGVTHVTLDSNDAHRIELNGQEPESVELLRRYVRLAPETSLTWEARTSGFPQATGLSWNIGEASAPVAAGEDWKSGSLDPRGQRGWAILTLRYQRPSGETRAEGFVEIRNVRAAGER